MGYHAKAILVVILVTVVWGGRGVSAHAEAQTFKDEGGRVIFTIEGDGTVTMYEKSPGDQTISVKQGTREEMQPRVTEITPDTVRAGTDHVIRLEGRNLVGAKVKTSVPGIEFGPYAGKPDVLDLPLHVPPTVPAGPVTLEVTTPIGGTTVNFKVVEFQIGGSASTRREQQTFTTSAPSSCPEGMLGVSFELGGFCIETDRTFSGEFRKAEKACVAGGKRLCRASEWQWACEQVKVGKLSLKNMPGQWEWTGSWESFDSPVEAMPVLQDVLLGKDDCQTKNFLSRGKADAFAGRCCK